MGCLSAILTFSCQTAIAQEAPPVLSTIHPPIQDVIASSSLSTASNNDNLETTNLLKPELKLESAKIKTDEILPKTEPNNDSPDAQIKSVSLNERNQVDGEKPVSLRIAQSTRVDSLGDTQPIDLTPVNLPRRAPSFDRFDRFNSSMLYHLPAKMFFSAVVDNSVRLETNVFQTNSRSSSDLVYRVLPNITVGYALDKKTRVSWNYFLLRDQYTKFNNPLSRDFHSTGWRIDRDFRLPKDYNLSVGFFGRALFANLDYLNETFFNDLIPSVTITKRVSPRAIAYGSCLGQIRFREMLHEYQEFDQFYSGGIVYRKRNWQVLADGTLVSNFGKPRLRGGKNNQIIILTQEIARKVHHRVPIQLFVRGQEIFNMGAPQSPGFAGFNYRIFGGFRVTVAKPPIFPIKLKGS